MSANQIELPGGVIHLAPEPRGVDGRLEITTPSAGKVDVLAQIPCGCRDEGRCSGCRARAAVAELIGKVQGVTDAADYMLRNPHDAYAQRHYHDRRDALLAALARVQP